MQMASQSQKETPDLSKPVLVRNYLVHSNFPEDHERKRLIDGVYGYLSEEGSHPWNFRSKGFVHMSSHLSHDWAVFGRENGASSLSEIEVSKAISYRTWCDSEKSIGAQLVYVPCRNRE